jgi:hypothetical protein
MQKTWLKPFKNLNLGDTLANVGQREAHYLSSESRCGVFRGAVCTNEADQ